MDATVLPNEHLLGFGCAPHCAALLLGLLSGATAQWPLEQLIKFTFPQFMAYSFRVMDHLGGQHRIFYSVNRCYSPRVSHRFCYSIVILSLPTAPPYVPASGPFSSLVSNVRLTTLSCAPPVMDVAIVLLFCCDSSENPRVYRQLTLSCSSRPDSHQQPGRV
jgi:hypothetical protein